MINVEMTWIGKDGVYGIDKNTASCQAAWDFDRNGASTGENSVDRLPSWTGIRARRPRRNPGASEGKTRTAHSKATKNSSVKIGATLILALIQKSHRSKRRKNPQRFLPRRGMSSII